MKGNSGGRPFCYLNRSLYGSTNKYRPDDQRSYDVIS